MSERKYIVEALGEDSVGRMRYGVVDIVADRLVSGIYYDQASCQRRADDEEAGESDD